MQRAANASTPGTTGAVALLRGLAVGGDDTSAPARSSASAERMLPEP